MMMLYHGSLSIVREPIVGLGRHLVDFGQGFYLTQIVEQASAWAKTCALRSMHGQPVLSIYAFDDQAAKVECGERYKIFTSYDAEWLEYVVDCRNGGNLQNGYDVIEGGVANDNVIDTVELYEKGYLTVEQAIDTLAFKKVNHQLCLRSQDIVDHFLKFIRVEEVQ